MATDISQSEAARAFAKIGFLSFGGPAAQIAVMHRVLVEEKKWLTEAQFLHALNFCMLLPGPEAMQLSTYAGWLLHGVRGGLIAGLLFILPGLVMMLAFSAIYVSFGDMPLVAGIFYGLKAAVIAVVLQALAKVAGKALKTRVMYAVAVTAFLLIFFLRVPFPIIVLGAAIAGFALWKVVPNSLPIATEVASARQAFSPKKQRTAFAQTFWAFLVWGGLWLIPLALLLALLPQSFEARAAAFFSQAALVTFGGAYAVLAYVGQKVVDIYGWLSTADMLKGLGLAETTLGPLVLVLVFVGFVGGANAVESGQLIGGLSGGLIAAFFTFVPCFLWVFAGAPHMERLRQIHWLSASLASVTAAVVGVILNLAVWFSLAVIFADPDYSQAGHIWLPQLELEQIDWAALIIAVSACVALIRLKTNLLIVLGTAALAGIVAAGIAG